MWYTKGDLSKLTVSQLNYWRMFSPAELQQLGLSSEPEIPSAVPWSSNLPEAAPEWSDEHEGQLAVDVLETAGELIIVATMAGTRAEDIELHLHNGLITIRGERHLPATGAEHYFYQECYWGKFSRTIVLPVDVRAELAQSDYRQGVLTVRLPKVTERGEIPILVIEE